MFTKNKGITLIELIIYIALTSIMLLGISSFITFTLKSRIKSQVVSEIEQQGVFVLQTINQTIRNAEGINYPLQGTSSNTLSLDDAQQTIFDVSNEVLRISQEGTFINLTNSKISVSEFSVQNLSEDDTPGIIKTKIILEYNNLSGKEEYNYSKTFYGSASLRY